jgi:hypothetical protein
MAEYQSVHEVQYFFNFLKKAFKNIFIRGGVLFKIVISSEEYLKGHWAVSPRNTVF